MWTTRAKTRQERLDYYALRRLCKICTETPAPVQKIAKLLNLLCKACPMKPQWIPKADMIPG